MSEEPSEDIVRNENARINVDVFYTLPPSLRSSDCWIVVVAGYYNVILKIAKDPTTAYLKKRNVDFKTCFRAVHSVIRDPRTTYRNVLNNDFIADLLREY